MNKSLKDSRPPTGAWSPLTFQGKGGRGPPFRPQRAAGPQRAVSQKIENKKTRNKKTNALMDRYWHNETSALTDIHIKKIFNKIGFACVIAPHIKSANTGALMLDSCLMRYTTWSNSERESFLLDF